MKKKNVLLVIRKGQPELDWITPLLFKMRSSLNIHIFFSSEKILPKIEKNPNYIILKQITKKIFWPKKLENLFWKILSKFLRIFHINISSTLKTFIYKKINNIENLKKNIGLNGEFDVVFTEYGNNSSWMKALFEYKKKPLIFNYPSSPLCFFQRKGGEDGRKFYRKKLICDYVFLISQYDFNYWSKSISKEKMLSVGHPGYDKWWLDKLFQNKKKEISKQKKLILFAYNSDFGLIPKKKEKYLENDLKIFMKTFTSTEQLRDVKVIFKIHPFRNNKKYLEILNNFNKNYWEISSEPLIFLASKVDAIISSFDSSALLDGLYAKKPSIEFFRSYYDGINYPKISQNKVSGVSVSLNKGNINTLLIEALFDKKNIKWKKQLTRFKRIYSTNSDNSSKACKIINKKIFLI